MGSPPVRPPRPRYLEISPDLAKKAIECVKSVLQYIDVGPPLIHRGPAGEVGIDVPLMYHGFALDRIHIDPLKLAPSPKGRPARTFVATEPSVQQVYKVAKKVVKELVVIEAAEFREPEACWVVPLAWNHYIVAHIKVSYDGNEIVPDYPLTEEVRRYVI